MPTPWYEVDTTAASLLIVSKGQGERRVKMGTTITLATQRKNAVKGAVSAGTIAWSSGTPGVATVGAGTGVVTPVAPGVTIITADDGAGHTDTISVRVVA